jgi:hypothetical protein
MRVLHSAKPVLRDRIVRPATRTVHLALCRFTRDESGTLIIFGLFIFVLMLFAGGMSVDLMRHEARRTLVQNTADRAVLAAAAMRQELEPEDVVADYFEKAGVPEGLTGITVDSGLNFRNVRADTSSEISPFFMQMLGVDSIEAISAGAAEERITNVEIALVLDVSGSMGSNSKIQNLRAAADEFIETILRDDQEDRVSIAVVPYNAQVNLGPDIFDKFNITHEHGVVNSWCVDMPSTVYNSFTLARTLAMPQHGHVDIMSTSSSSNSYQTPQSPSESNRHCKTTTANHAVPPTNDETVLRNKVTGLTAQGNTSIDAGFRWGLTLLDPASRSVIADLAADGAVPAHFANRPLDFDPNEVLKVVVLMTDGEHVASQWLNTDYRTGLSPIYRSTNNNRYSIFHSSASGSNKYWVPHLSTWQSVPFSDGGRTQLTWPQVWSNVRMTWVARQLYARAFGNSSTQYNNAMNAFRSSGNAGSMNTRLNTLCTNAKGQGVVIFGIAFEAPSVGVTTIRNCASPGLFYDVNGLEIATAFRHIRSQISKLRLTQ